MANTMQKDNLPNIELEIAITRIARTLYDFDGIMTELQSRANEYVNQTGRLHPDLGLELREWITFKWELLAPDHEERVKEGKSGLTRSFVDDYGKTPEEIISNLEKELGITN
jgi:hypothetical protein